MTLRGFKSFASATTLHLEPGITCVVGPNGSGKSNVVDALAWVMGEQGAKSLRGGQMSDVIFAGTSSRPPLGRAEVALTIDNSDGALPIDYAEVTISRTMFSSGGSEYAINGTPCRLLDIQDLLSDSGLGRQMHVIVGQGQLDAVLRATPEERRGFIEEAAGILKHRKRKEKALRKLESTAANLARLTDLVGEIRRQLGPLARQAEVARRAATVQADLRDARARLLADDLAQARAAHAAEVADVTALEAAREEVEAALETARAELARTEAEGARLAPAVAEATEVWYRLSGVRERLRGTATLADERCRLLGTAVAQHDGPDPDDLDAQAERAREAERLTRAELAAATAALEAALGARRVAEEAAAAAEKELAAVHRGVADRREGLARLAGKVGAVRSRVEAQQAELERLGAVLTDASRRASEAEVEFAELELTAAGVQDGEEGLDAAHESASARLEQAREEIARLEAELRTATGDADRWTARHDALALSAERGDGTGALLADDGVAGLRGPLADALAVAPGWEAAVAAALGELVDAAVVDGVGAAVDALRRVRETDAGRARLVLAQDAPDGEPEASAAVAAPAAPAAAPDAPAAPPGATWALAEVTIRADVRSAVVGLLDGVALVEDLGAARAALAAPGVRVVATREGDVLTATHASGGVSGEANLLAITAAREEAARERDAARERGDRARFALQAAREGAASAQAAYDATLADLHASDAAFTAVAERLGRLSAAIRGARGEAQRAEAAIAAAEAGREERESELADLLARLEVAQAEPADAAADLDRATEHRDACADAARAARSAETDARLAMRTVEERTRAAAGRAASLERAARVERDARARAASLEAARQRRAAVADRVRQAASATLVLLETSLARAAEDRDAAQQQRAEVDERIATTRTRVDVLARRLAELTDAFHRDELARAEQRMRVEALEQRSLDELALDPEILLAEFGPDVPVPLLGVAGSDATDATEATDAPDDPDASTPTEPYDRDRQKKRLRSAERALALLGKVNPLALEEHAALEERHAFLVEQLADVRKSRADLLEIVKEIDARVEQVFTEAWVDTEREFRGVFARLFPGGEGRLLLTEPDDMLTTGIEVEARPPGKKVKRLSLLSGGERSLTAVALLVAIFRARPSPFYVMDEVEAALDDVNLGRLLEIFAELRSSSQLIVITHQKRTMEIADALYGVTMRGDGVSAVIGQRIERDGEPGDPDV
ncbi:chromosome segregation protein SMC [Miniimonas arenae]|uniref:Chromosome partition protein Smc n=1 Tax=Miniimonas arenae TaxID=676201 RepID=A0A5C5BH58_9MICO|nr:chromosome segregation protein SMC [Miniimonas arenae]